MNYEFKLVPHDNMDRLNTMVSPGAIFIKSDAVNLDDLLESARPGAIVRCTENPRDVVLIVPHGDAEAFGCVAGWVSEDA